MLFMAEQGTVPCNAKERLCNANNKIWNCSASPDISFNALIFKRIKKNNQNIRRMSFSGQVHFSSEKVIKNSKREC